MSRARLITVAALPSEPRGAFLFCDCCDGQFSACRGDYWHLHASHVMRCGCNGKTPLRLVRRVSFLEDVGVQS